ncbi:MAG TPA: hypothetical protein VJ824_08155 [Bacillota bacterium]|nr:hypothetical protein [Bacillota bacterium]
MLFQTWIKRFLPNRTFTQNFQISHQFHGIIENQIEETYIIQPISDLGLQTLLDGIQISDQSLHLKSRIDVYSDSIKVSLKVIDPIDAQKVLNEVKITLVRHLLNFEKRFYSSPVVQYVEKFCQQCTYNKSKPLNQCIANCRFQPKKQDRKEAMIVKP